MRLTFNIAHICITFPLHIKIVSTLIESGEFSRTWNSRSGLRRMFWKNLAIISRSVDGSLIQPNSFSKAAAVVINARQLSSPIVLQINFYWSQMFDVSAFFCYSTSTDRITSLNSFFVASVLWCSIFDWIWISGGVLFRTQVFNCALQPRKFLQKKPQSARCCLSTRFPSEEFTCILNSSLWIRSEYEKLWEV